MSSMFYTGLYYRTIFHGGMRLHTEIFVHCMLTMLFKRMEKLLLCLIDMTMLSQQWMSSTSDEQESVLAQKCTKKRKKSSAIRTTNNGLLNCLVKGCKTLGVPKVMLTY